MAVSRTPKRGAPTMQEREEENDWSIQPMEFAEDPNDNPPVDDRDERIKSLEQQIAEMHQKLEDNTSDRLLQNFTQPMQVPQEFKGEPLVTLPDVNQDFEGWAAAVQKNAEINARNLVAKQQFEAGRTQSLDQQTQELFDQFNEDYEDFAAMGTEKIEFAATQVAKRAKARGIDVQRYMFTTRDRFLRDVAKEMEKTFGAPDDMEDDEDTFEERTPRRRGRPARDDTRTQRRPRRERNRSQDDDLGRTAGIFGGQDSGGRMSGYEQDDGRGMIDDFQSLQRKTGFF